MMIPKVSVVIPAYNSEEYLRECLESVRSQTLDSIEVICVNDGSSDGTLSIMREYEEKDSRFRVIDKTNAGYGAAMNDGIKAAKGEYIGIVESDDYVLPETYEQYYNLAKSNGGLDIVKSDFKLFYGDGEKRTFVTRELSDKPSVYNRIVDLSTDSTFFHLNNLSQPGIYRRSFLIENEVRYNETPGASYQDNGFWFQVFAQARSALFVKNAYYMLRRDNPNSSVKSKAKVYCMCDEYDFIRDILIERRLNHLLGMCAKKRFSNYEWTCQRVDERLLYGFFDRYGKDFVKLEELGDLDRKYFSPSEWQRLREIMSQGSDYYINGWLPRLSIARLKNDVRHQKQLVKKEKREVERVRSSNSFKVGKLITGPARYLKIFLRSSTSETSRCVHREKAKSRKIQDPTSTDAYRFNSTLAAEDIPEQIARVYGARMHGRLDFDNARSYNEKVQLRKVFDPQRDIKTKLADKYAVRDWVAERIGDKYLVPLLGVWNDFEEIDFSSLPDKFVLKATHGCAMTEIVRDKENIDPAFLSEQFAVWLKTNFEYCNGFEMQYANIQPRIIAEEYLENDGGDLYDYKFWCFDGKVRYIQYLSNRSKSLKMSFFDRNWNLQPFRYDHPGHNEEVPRPDNLDEMVGIAEALACGFDHVRVDLYNTVDSGIKFGEMTFSSAGGYCHWNPPEFDYVLGDLWNIDL